MSRLSRLSELGSLLLQRPWLLVRPPRAIFMLGHMRARTSVLSHIIGSHSQVVGHGELLQAYQKNRHLLRARLRLRQKREHVFFHDKLLHNYTALDDRFLLNPAHRIVFILREPFASTQSFVRLHHKTEPDSEKTVSEIQEMFSHYYCERLPMLVEMAKKIGPRAHLVDPDRLITHTEETLEELTDFLGLTPSLEREYRLVEESGTAGHGDPTGALEKGCVIATQYNTEFPVKKEVLEKMKLCFVQTTDQIQNALKNV